VNEKHELWFLDILIIINIIKVDSKWISWRRSLKEIKKTVIKQLLSRQLNRTIMRSRKCLRKRFHASMVAGRWILPSRAATISAPAEARYARLADSRMKITKFSASCAHCRRRCASEVPVTAMMPMTSSRRARFNRLEESHLTPIALKSSVGSQFGPSLMGKNQIKDSVKLKWTRASATTFGNLTRCLRGHSNQRKANQLRS